MIIGDVREPVWSVYFARKDEELLAALWERGTCGLQELEDGYRAYFAGGEAEAMARALGRELCGGGAREELDNAVTPPLDDTCDPILIGERFYIGAAEAVTDGRIALAVQKGNGFGTGRHETTQLCLVALERLLRPGDRVLDVGCGSGILSLAARLLGAGAVMACDLFEDVAAAARENSGALAFAGSADSVTSGSFDLVLANLTDAVLDRLAFDLKRVTKPQGRLLVSGFLQSAPPRQFASDIVLEQGEWQCWICRPGQIAATSLGTEGGLTHATEWWL